MRWLPLALSLSLALGACDHAMSSLPSPPASARALDGGGAYESRMGQVVADMRRRLAQHGLGAIEVEAYQLPSDATWEQVAAHYGALPAGLQRVEDIAGPDSGFAYRWRVWRDGDRAYAVVFVDDPVPGQDVDFKLLLIATPK